MGEGGFGAKKKRRLVWAGVARHKALWVAKDGGEQQDAEEGRSVDGGGRPQPPEKRTSREGGRQLQG